VTIQVLPLLADTTEVTLVEGYCLLAVCCRRHIMRTIELGVTITDAAIDDDATTIFCTPVSRNPRCPDPRWGEVFGDDVVAAAMIDRLVRHAEVIALKGDSYRIKDRDLGRVPGSTTGE
jgi:hypothetical protein